VVARRGPALLLRCAQGAVWVGHVRRGLNADGTPALKLAATLAFEAEAAALPEWRVPLHRDDGEWDELRYTESGGPQASVGWLDFDFHNGAVSERQAAAWCRRWTTRAAATRACWCWPAVPTSSATASTCTTSRRPRSARATARPMRPCAPSRPSTTWRWPSCN
jgi:hypothetical protein